MLFSVQAGAAIFGQDDRSYITATSPDAARGRAVAIGILNTLVKTKNDGRIDIQADSMNAYMCKDERFYRDPSIGWGCTGFLIAPRLLVTAGHCQVNQGETRNNPGDYCQVYRWLFDFQADAQGNTPIKDLDPARLYDCKRTIYAVVDEKNPYNDFALIELDRDVVGREPLVLSNDDNVSVGQSVHMVGHPLASPMKLTANAKVTKNVGEAKQYLTDLDAMDGNSGSPVFNARNEVIGILVAGTPADLFYKDPVLKCDRYNVCDENGLNCRTPTTQENTTPFYPENGALIQRLAPLKEILRQHKEGRL